MRESASSVSRPPRWRGTAGAVFRRSSWAVLLVISLAACMDYSRLAFRQDHRLEFTAPRSYELVKTPITVSWKMDDFDVVKPESGAPRPSTGYFAIFVDRAPVKPGHTLRDVADGDGSCLRDPDCPDAAYLADRGVYTTTTPSVELASIPALESQEAVQLHEATVVLLDSTGHRIGEAAWHIPFKLAKGSLG